MPKLGPFEIAVPSINSSCMRLANCRCFRHQVLLSGCGQWYRCGRDRVTRPSEQENFDSRPQRNRRHKEDVSKGEPSRGQTGLHSRSSDLTSELQSSVRSDEVVIATEQLQVLIEPLRRASVGKRSSRKVCRALPDGQIQPVPSINSSCMRLANFLQPGCFGRLHVGRFKSRRRLYSGVEV